VDDLGTNPHVGIADDSVYIGHLTGTTAQMTPSLFLSLGTANPQPGPEGLVVDDAPTFSATNANPTFTESASNPASTNNTPVGPSSGASASDPDSFGELASATAKITSGLFAGDALSANGQSSGLVAGTNITVSYDSASGTLTLTGADTFAHYQTVLN